MKRSQAFLLAVVAVVAMIAPGASAGATAGASGFDPEMERRIALVREYVADRPGITGIVLRDRRTGAIWRNEHAATHAWACSNPKLAMVVDLLLRDRSGAITLTEHDRLLMHKMLYKSDNNAATTLWNRYGGEDFATRFPTYGMTDMHFTDEHPHTWGWIRTTPDDLDRLTNYILRELPAELRDYIVREMRNVHPNQRWGVWGAGEDAEPGNKNGWADDNDDGSWVTNSAGFAGPRQRFTLAIMSNTQVVEDGDQVGMETTTEIARILFRGYFDPA